MFQQVDVEWCWAHASVSRWCPVAVPDAPSRGPSRRGVFPTNSCPCLLLWTHSVKSRKSFIHQDRANVTISYSLTFELSLSNLKTVWTLWILFIISLKQIEQKQDICTQLYDMAIYRYSKELPLLMDTAVWWCMFNEFRYRRMLSCHSNTAICYRHRFPPFLHLRSI